MVHAARLLGELVERGGVELRALDRDDVDRRAGIACGRDRVVQRGGAARLVAVGHDDHHARLERLVREHVRGLDDRVVERGALDGVDLDRPSAPTESLRSVEKSVRSWGFVANVATATRSSAGFEATKLRAAAIACASGAPRIDCERSIARTTDFSAPRFSVRSIRTASPFSRSFGACELGSDVRTVTRMTGY